MKKILCYALTLAMVLSLFTGMTVTVSADTLTEDSDSGDYVTVSELAGTATSDSESTLDELYANFSSGYNEDGSVDNSIYDYDENSASTGLETLEDYPDSFDLRHVGGTYTYNSETKKTDATGGKSYVTPVKFQNPWGTCWAFGICAASETSILYELGLGTDDVINDNLDLSEHHLAWFTKNHLPAITDEGYGINYVDNQDGEGMYWYAGTTNSSMEGGAPYYGTSIFATGTGVVSESFAPYCGKNKQVMCARNSTADTDKYPDNYLYYDSVEAWEAETDEGIKANYRLYCYSGQDDWSLDESLRFYQSYALEESNILPAANGVINEDEDVVELNEDGINAIKSELLEGKAVEIGFCADSSTPTQAFSSESTSRYINSNWAHYTWDGARANHSVCIVGWDDDYDASNFGQSNPVVYDATGNYAYKLKNSDQMLSWGKDDDGNYVLYYTDEAGVDHVYALDSDEIELAVEKDGSVSVPDGNGAWIVKNSWGSSTSEFPNNNTWGVDGSGYFYISYYDTSISLIETYDFVVTEDEKEDYDYSIIDQYDYLPASSSSQTVSYSPVMMANVFTASEDMEIEALSCETTTPGTVVVYGICLLEDGQDYPSGDSKVIKYTDPVEYEYGGYHRLQLDESLFVKKGQKYCVIAIEASDGVDDSGNDVTKYYVSSRSAFSKDYVYAPLVGYYNVGVVNPGESYILTSGYNSEDLVAVDYYDFISYLRTTDATAKNMQQDNFSIKAYGKPVYAFSDISDCSTNTKEAIEWATDENIVNGYEDGTFRPTADTTRLQMAIMLWRMLGKPEPESIDSALKFTDTQSLSTGAKKAIAWAVEQGIIKGYSDGTFRPNDSVTRQQAVIMLWRMSGSPDVDTSTVTFTDTADLSATSQKAIAWAVNCGITKGTKQSDGSYKFNPKETCQRQHSAIFLYRYYSVVD